MFKKNAFLASGLGAAILLAACSAAAPPEEEASPGFGSQSQTLPPPGYGTLRQDDFTVALQAGDTQVKVTPLDESVIRLAAPDTYQRLHGLVASRRERILDAARRAGLRGEPSVFLVSFFTRAQQATYEPTNVQLLSKSILYRPAGILPLTPEWGRQQVKQEETQSALYVFDGAVDLDVTFEVEYQGSRSLAWAGIIRKLQAERARVMSRTEGVGRSKA
ncbi:MAG: hypothetical protein JSV86_02205 [Gemmatimonadota bacterium]|nr:MAG: hypothetical protein JSV86_02205 [Gemmatimonadota bacterium]